MKDALQLLSEILRFGRSKAARQGRAAMWSRLAAEDVAKAERIRKRNPRRADRLLARADRRNDHSIALFHLAGSAC